MGGIPGTVAKPSPDVVSTQFHPDSTSAANLATLAAAAPSGTAGTPAGAVQSVQGVSGGTPVQITTSATAATARPESAALVRPNDTTAYAQNDLIANSTTAGSVSYPTIAVGAASGRPVRIWRVRLWTDKISGWDATTFNVRLWSAAPTYTNGDNGAYSPATGAAAALAVCGVSLTQFADGAVGHGVPTVGSFAQYVPATTLLYWDIQYTGAAALTPAALQQFKLAVELEQL